MLLRRTGKAFRLGTTIPKLVAEALLNNSAFKDDIHQHLSKISGVVYDVQFNDYVGYQVKVVRTGKRGPDGAWYPVYIPNYIPEVNDDVLLDKPSPMALPVVIGARKVGNPPAMPGGSVSGGAISGTYVSQSVSGGVISGTYVSQSVSGGART